MWTAIKKNISLPPDLAREAEETAHEEGKTLSAVIQDALRVARKNRLKKNLSQVQGYWSRRAKEKGILNERDLKSLIETAHLLRSPKNAKRILSALDRAMEHKGQSSIPDHLRNRGGKQEIKISAKKQEDAIMKTATATELRNNLSAVLASIINSNEVIITMRGKPIAIMKPVGEIEKYFNPVGFGIWKGRKKK
jgi:PHD/YefM family antitoxin component YafN of YafNO toxin-antitoxin module